MHQKLKIRASRWPVVPACTAHLFQYPLLSSRAHMQHHTQAQGWWRDYYEAHPHKGTTSSDAWAPGKSHKYKMYCKECWIHHFAVIKDVHSQADHNGTVCTYPREDPAILEYCSHSISCFHNNTEYINCSVGTICIGCTLRECTGRITPISSLYISEPSCNMPLSNHASKTACDQWPIMHPGWHQISALCCSAKCESSVKSRDLPTSLHHSASLSSSLCWHCPSSWPQYSSEWMVSWIRGHRQLKPTSAWFWTTSTHSYIYTKSSTGTRFLTMWGLYVCPAPWGLSIGNFWQQFNFSSIPLTSIK